jgi:hypothetical protein
MRQTLKFWLLVCINLVSLGNVLAQTNLVLNPSFEQYTLCPGTMEVITNGKVTYCSNPNSLTPDYFNICDSNSANSSFYIPDNVAGYQEAKEGNGYIGLATWTKTYTGGEYIQMKLANPLLNGRQYAFKCYLSNAEVGNYGSGDMGVYFSNDSVYNTSYLLPFTPQIQNQSGNFFADTINWMSFAGNYTAAGGERFLIIGNFNDGIDNPDTIRIGHYAGVSAHDRTYFYIDDVSLTEVTGIAENEKINFELFPNPANQNLQVNSSKPISRIVIYNIAGELVLDFNQLISLNKFVVDISTLAAGTYNCMVYDDKTKFAIKKFSIIK